MNNTDSIPNEYSTMVQEIGVDKFTERFEELKKTANEFIEEAGYGGHVECNERILLNVLLDYWADIFRLKDFHKIEKARTEKVFSYLIAWIIKRKPLQFIHYTKDEKDIFVNERFALFLLLNECLLSGEKKFVTAESQKQLCTYIEMVLYYFKYRECNPQVIELMIESFKMGSLTVDSL